MCRSHHWVGPQISSVPQTSLARTQATTASVTSSSISGLLSSKGVMGNVAWSDQYLCENLDKHVILVALVICRGFYYFTITLISLQMECIFEHLVLIIIHKNIIHCIPILCWATNRSFPSRPSYKHSALTHYRPDVSRTNYIKSPNIIMKKHFFKIF